MTRRGIWSRISSQRKRGYVEEGGESSSRVATNDP